MSKFNLALLTNQERDDIELERRASMLIRQVKTGTVTKQFVKSELARESNTDTHAKFKSYLNKYRVLETTRSKKP